MYNKRNVTSAAFLAMLIFGIVMAVLGSVLPSVIEKFKITIINAGSLFVIMNLGMLLGSMIFGPIVDRYGYKGLLTICAIIIFAGIEGIALSPTMFLLKVSLFFVGFAGGAINGGANALVADINEGNKSSGLSYLGVFFGIGAFSVPFILGSLLDHFKYETIIGAVGMLILIPLLFFTFISFPGAKHSQGVPLKESTGLLKETLLLLLGMMLFIQSGLEMVISGWSSTYFSESFHTSPREAVLLLSVYWLALMIARIILGKILVNANHTRVLNMGLIIALAGTILMVLGPTKYVALSGLALTGFGFAAVFPMVLGFVGDAYARLSGTAFSLVLAMGLLGGMFLPWITGIMAEQFGLRYTLLLAPLCLLASLIIFNIIRKQKSLEKHIIQ
ncbi:fucose permease [Bacteroidales bacterium 6E]|nr:fucose permease [Bacteroidales bacterium 6E]